MRTRRRTFQSDGMSLTPTLSRSEALRGIGAHGGRGRARGGFSLIEVAVSSVLVGSILVTALSTVGAVLRFRSSTSDQARAALLATELLGEIQNQTYSDPNQTPILGRETGETARALFDDVDDYHLWTETPPKDLAGTNLTGFTSWARSVTVVWVQRNSPTQTSGSDEGLKRIRVSVAKNGVRLLTMDALKAGL